MSDKTRISGDEVPGSNVITETQKGQQRVLFSLTWQGWLQWGSVLVLMCGAYWKVVGNTEINALRITNVEKTVVQIQADRDRDTTRNESLLHDANMKLDGVKSNLDKLIGRFDGPTHTNE